MGWFFTKAALMTFRGAYAVLPYVYPRRSGNLSLAQPGADDGRPWRGANHARPLINRPRAVVLD